MNHANKQVVPVTLPQHDSLSGQEQRAYQLALARTCYNYMFSYLEPLPLSADLPKGEAYSAEYELKIIEAIIPMAENFKKVVIGLFEKQFTDQLGAQALDKVEKSYQKLVSELSPTHLLKDIELLQDFLKNISDLPKAMKGLVQVPKDINKLATGLERVFDEFLQDGPTAFLKSTLFNTLSTEYGRDYLQAKTIKDYDELFDSITKPTMLTIKKQSWMPDNDKPCEQDWFFGYLQIAGFNTTNLRGVVVET